VRKIIHILLVLMVDLPSFLTAQTVMTTGSLHGRVVDASGAVVAQVFNVANHANYYVQNGTGVNQVQYSPVCSNCGDRIS